MNCLGSLGASASSFGVASAVLNSPRSAATAPAPGAAVAADADAAAAIATTTATGTP